LFFILIKNRKNTLGLKEKCSICNGKIELRYKPMKEWNVEEQYVEHVIQKKLTHTIQVNMSE